MKIIGIDFGHGETSAGYVDSETVVGNEIPMRDLKISGEQIVIPSVICKTHNDEYVINPSANQIAKANEVGVCFKAPLVGSDKYSKITDANRVFFQAFLSKVYRAIISNDNNPLHIDNAGNMDFKVYIACPSGWNEEQIQAYKTFVQNDCKIPLIDIVKESRAAFIAARRKVGNTAGIRNQGGNVLVIDFGSSTVDFTYFNNSLTYEPIHEGYPYGASQIEEEVLTYLINSNPEAKRNVEYVIERCGKTSAVNSLLFRIRKEKEAYFSQDNTDYFMPSVCLKDLLSDRNLADRYIEPREESGISKSELTGTILQKYISSLSDMLDDFCQKEGVGSIDIVILTGGASRMYFFKELVSEKYGVSKQNQTLIVDLDPRTTISQGIAAFGYMNEQAKPLGDPLEDANKWLSEQLPQLFKSTIEKCIGDMYYDEFSVITGKYGEGNIVKDGNHNLDGLEDEIVTLLNSWSASGDMMCDKINNAINESMILSIGKKMTDYATAWGYETCANDFNIDLKLDLNISLTTQASQNLINYMWTKLKIFINERDFFGWDDKTSPYKDRYETDRKSIIDNLNENFRVFFNDLNYVSPIDDEIAEISLLVKNKLSAFLSRAKLQQYR